mmetsp:Transcript_28549/g.25439  ORF Transcript_28549/g.25439 Transcript_28549/m.25439 type:complete len:383 (+) Transcript_28549:1944-3092(+)
MKGQKWPKYSLDLTTNKANAAKVLSFYIPKDEYCLCLEFEKFHELKSITLGMLAMADFGQDAISVMPDIFVEAGPALNDMRYLGKMQYDGKATNNFSVLLYSIIADSLTKNKSTSSTVSDNMQDSQKIRCKYMKLRFRKPVIKFFEGFGFSDSKKFSRMNVNIVFISSSGIDVSKYGNIRDQILERNQQMAMRVVDLLSTKDLNVWQELAQEGFLLEKNKASLRSISKLIDINNQLISKILLSFAKYSDRIGTWLFESLLESNQSTKYSALVGELITNDPQRVYKRLDKLNKFLLREATTLSRVAAPEQYASEFDALLQFIDILTSTVHVLPEEKSSKVVFDVTKTDIENLINLFNKFQKSTPSSAKITKLIICYVFPPKTF